MQATISIQISLTTNPSTNHSRSRESQSRVSARDQCPRYIFVHVCVYLNGNLALPGPSRISRSPLLSSSSDYLLCRLCTYDILIFLRLLCFSLSSHPSRTLSLARLLISSLATQPGYHDVSYTVYASNTYAANASSPFDSDTDLSINWPPLFLRSCKGPSSHFYPYLDMCHCSSSQICPSYSLFRHVHRYLLHSNTLFTCSNRAVRDSRAFVSRVSRQH